MGKRKRPDITDEELLNSEIFGPKNYLEGKTPEQILAIAKPLIEALESEGFIQMRNSWIFKPENPKEVLENIKNLTDEGKEDIIHWLYYSGKEKRAELLNIAQA